MSAKRKPAFPLLAGSLILILALTVASRAQASALAPGAFDKLTPASGSLDQPTLLTLDWSESAGADSYQYCYDTTNDNACSIWISVGPATYALLSDLSLDTTYYWQVRAVKFTRVTYANGARTAFWSFKTESAPVPFSKTAPADGATDQPTTLNLTWSVSSGANYYEYCIDNTDDNACSSWTSNGLYNNKILSGLPPNTAYYWQVRAVTPSGTIYADGSDSDFWSFTTGSAPGAFGKLGPANGVTGQPTSFALSWSASAGAASYEICYDTTNDNNCTKWLANGNAANRTISGLTPGVTYYWQVRAVNSFGTVYANGALATFWSFKIGSPPSTPALVSPADNALVLVTRPLFDWNNSTLSGGTAFLYYEFQIDVSATFGSATTYTTASGDVTASNFTPPADLARATTYYWRVRALNTFNEASAWSSVRSVRIAYAPPTLLAPANGATGVPLKPTFTWDAVVGATDYTLQISRYGSFRFLVVNKTVPDPAYTMLANLSRNTQYFWRVRVNGLYGPSEWTVFYFRTTP
ncbi:MAG: fibronectin type III domain-containing protein [Chloroflexota bacterium]